MMVNSNSDNHDNNQQAKSTSTMLHQPTKSIATVGEQLKQQQAEESQFQANLQSQPNPNKEKVTIWNFITYPDLSYADHFPSELSSNDNRFNAHHHPKSPNFTTKNVNYLMENQCHDHGRKLENQVPRTDDDFINQTKRQRQQSPQGANNLASVKIAPKEEMLPPQQKSCLFDNVNQQPPQQKEQNAQPKAESEKEQSRKIEQMQREYENEEYEDKLETDRLREKQQTLPQGNIKQSQSHPQSTSFIINLWPNAFSSSHHIHHQTSSKLPEIVKHFTLKLKTFSFFQNKATEKQNKKTTINKKKINKKNNPCQTVQSDPENSILIDQVQQDRRETDRLESIMQRASLYAAFVIVCFLIVLVVNKIHAQYGTDSKRLLLQQQIVQPVGRLDLSKYEHLNQRREQIKNPPLERLEETLTKGKLKTDSNKRLLIAGAGDGGNGGGTSNPIVEKFRYGIDSRITTSSMVNSAVRKQEKHDNSLREIEWDSSEGSSTSSTEAPNKQRKQNLYYAPQQKKQPNRGEPEQVPKNSAPYLLGDDCSSCVKQNYLAHYLEKGCKPVYRTECDCAKYFRCPRKPPQAVLSSQDSLKIAEREEKPCVYDNKVYDFGEQIPMPDEPCRLCRCRKRRFYNGTLTKTYGEVDCSLFVECPEMVFGVKPKRASCHFAYRHDQCCGKEICVDELPPEDVQVRTTCRYRSKTYRYGQIIYPEENSCTKCICDETWNEHNPLGSGGCQKRKCTAFLQENILHKCTPVYRIDGCCPIEFICPEKRKLYDPEMEEEQDSLPFDIELPQNGEKCVLNGTSYSVGDKLYVDRKDTQHGRTCARCECQVPPMLTCKADFKCSGL